MTSSDNAVRQSFLAGQAYVNGQKAALAKLAFGPEEAARVLQLGKKMAPGRAVERAALREAGMHTAAGLGSAPSYAAQARVQHQIARGVEHPEISKQLAATAALPQDSVLGQLAQTHPGGTYMRGNGNALRSLADAGIPVPSTLPPSQQKMLNAVITGHELDEAKTLSPGMGMAHMGHRSPDVVLREHNRVATLPAEHAPVRDIMTATRQPYGEAALLKQYGVEYGQPGGRISRHLRKSITRDMNTTALNARVRDINDVYRPIPDGEIKFAMDLQFSSPAEAAAHDTHRNIAGALLGGVPGAAIGGAALGARYGKPGAILGGFAGGLAGSVGGKLLADVAHDVPQRTMAAHDNTLERLNLAGGFGTRIAALDRIELTTPDVSAFEDFAKEDETGENNLAQPLDVMERMEPTSWTNEMSPAGGTSTDADASLITGGSV